MIDAYLGAHHDSDLSDWERSVEPTGASDQRDVPVTTTRMSRSSRCVVAGYVPGVDILNGCELTLDEGELVGIIGPNGAGKSTLLKALFGLIPVREGSVMLRGEDITGAQGLELVAKGVGFVPQTNNVFPSLTIEENLEMGVYLDPSGSTSGSRSSSTCSPAWASAASSGPARCRAASARWWPWAGRS